MLLIDHSKTLCNGKEKADKGKEVREWREEEEDGGRRTTRYKTGTAFGSLTFWSFGDIDFIQMVSMCMHVRHGSCYTGQSLSNRWKSTTRH